MTDADKRQAAARKSARNRISALEAKLARADRTISALVDKLARAESQVVEARREMLRRQAEFMGL